MQANSAGLSQFGQELRAERERRGLSAEAICAVTKVSLRHIAALEAGHLEELPGGVFRKGIVRGYLAAAGLDQAEWMSRFGGHLQESGTPEPDGHDWAEFAENVRRNRARTGRPTGLRWIGVVLMLLALLVCGWLTWKYVLRERIRMPVAGMHAGNQGVVTGIAQTGACG